MLISQQHKAVILRPRDPNRILTLIPTARLIHYRGQPLVAVPHRVAEARVLNNLNIRVPSPIRFHYDWPSRYPGGPFEAQRATSEFLTLHPRAFVLNEMGCVDSDTEYLSPTGWKRIADYRGGAVAQYWPETKAVNFVEAPEFVKLPCTDMVRIKTKYGVDQLLSPEHRVLLQASGNPCKREVVPAGELLARHDAWVEGARLKRSEERVGYSQAAIPNTFRVTGGSGVALTDEDLRVQVAVIADSHFPNGTSRCAVRLKKPRKKARLRALLRAAGTEYVEREVTRGTAAGYSVFAFTAPLKVKEFDDRFWACTSQQLRVIADEVLHWDGSVSADKPSARFSTLSKASADFVQYAFVSTGRTARVHSAYRDRGDKGFTEYSVQVRAHGKPLMIMGKGSTGGRLQSMSTEASTDGFKYCFMVPSTFLVLRRNGCVFCTGNTGKTLAGLWAADYLMRCKVIRSALVVCPLSTIHETWEAHIREHFLTHTVAVLHGSAVKRRRLLAQPHDFYIINHDGVEVVRDELIAHPRIGLVITDELAEFSNARTGKWEALRDVVQTREWVWGFTGTPTPQAPTDAWAQVKLIKPENAPKRFTRFRDATMLQQSAFKWVPRDTALEVVHTAMQPSIRFSREECMDLPECTYVSRSVDLTPEQTKAYKELLKAYATEYAEDKITAANEGVKRGKLIQVLCGAVYPDGGGVVHIPCGPRLKVVEECIRDAPGKVIVFAPLVAVVQMLLAWLGKQYETAAIWGDTPVGRRKEILHDFQKTDRYRVLVAHPETMAHGITLTKAATIIWYGPTSARFYEQANARITRAGQTMMQTIVHIESTALERQIYTRLREKLSLQGVLLGMLQETGRKAHVH